MNGIEAGRIMTVKEIALPPPAATLTIGVLCGMTAALLWAGQVPVSAIAVRGNLPAADLVALRFIVSGLLLVPVLWHGRGQGPLAGIGWRRGIILSLTGGPAFLMALMAGLAYAPASHSAAIVNGLTPVFAVLLGISLLGLRPGGRELAGIAVVLAGVMMLGWQSLMTDIAMPDAWLGDLLFLAAAILWGSYTVLCRRWDVHPLRGAAVLNVLGAAYLPFWLLFYDSHIPAAPWGEIVWQCFYQGVATGIVAIVVYSRAIALLGSSLSSLFSAFIPALVILMAIPVLGEQPAPAEWAGIALATVGMILALGRRR
jgi:drug/metabolite transporter (DMT)-like permease